MASNDLKYQLRLTLKDGFAQTARDNPKDASIAPLTGILNRHDAALITCGDHHDGPQGCAILSGRCHHELAALAAAATWRRRRRPQPGGPGGQSPSWHGCGLGTLEQPSRARACPADVD